jgi:hypothetical protein
MKVLCSLMLPFVLCLSFASATEELADEEGFVSMFNGKDLAGWEGKAGGWWVEDGALTSESTEEKPCKKHHYLFWETAQPADFILRFRYRLTGMGNSGVQIRSKKLSGFDAWGYQADIEAGTQWTGCLFQHDRAAVVKRGFKADIAKDGTREDRPFSDPAKLQDAIRPGTWNEYEVAAIGPRVTLRINGQLMCEVEDRDAKMACEKGYIAVQMHPGPPMKIQFKDLRIKILK